MPPHPPHVPCYSSRSRTPARYSPSFPKTQFCPKDNNAYNRELLFIYEAVKNFRHILEARLFTIFTDHKPITYAFQQMRDKWSPRQFNHRDFVAQFTRDNKHISRQDNVVADALCRVESVTAPPSYDATAHSVCVDVSSVDSDN
jgi:hypothetical protein